jgi:hypothetical protein
MNFGRSVFFLSSPITSLAPRRLDDLWVAVIDEMLTEYAQNGIRDRVEIIDPVALFGKTTYPSDATDELADLWETQLRPGDRSTFANVNMNDVTRSRLYCSAYRKMSTFLRMPCGSPLRALQVNRDSDLDVEFLRCPRFGGCNSIKIDPENNWFDTRYPFLVGTSVSCPTGAGSTGSIGGYISMRIKDSTDDTKPVQITTSFQSPTMVSV